MVLSAWLWFVRVNIKGGGNPNYSTLNLHTSEELVNSRLGVNIVGFDWS